MNLILANGTHTRDRRLDRLPQFDPESRKYSIYHEPGKPLEARLWALDTFLDQGQEGSCVGHGWAHELAAEPVSVEMKSAHAIKIYREAQKRDPWPGENYEGTSVLGAAKYLVEQGCINSYLWAFSLEDAVRSIVNAGPVVIGVNWYTGMGNTDRDGYIHVSGEVRGGHCVVLVGFNPVWTFPESADRSWANIDLKRSYLTVHNSWGKTWGVVGRAKITLQDFDRLRKEQGEVCIPVGRNAVAPDLGSTPKPPDPKPPRRCLDRARKAYIAGVRSWQGR